MTYQHKIVLFIAVIVLAAGGVAAWRWWPRRSADQAPPVIEAVRERPAIPVPAVPFRDATAEANIQFQHFNGAYGLKLLPETMGPGVCVLDYDNDGWQDILLINGCPWPGPQPASQAVCVLALRGGVPADRAVGGFQRTGSPPGRPVRTLTVIGGIDGKLGESYFMLGKAVGVEACEADVLQVSRRSSVVPSRREDIHPACRMRPSEPTR